MDDPLQGCSLRKLYWKLLLFQQL